MLIDAHMHLGECRVFDLNITEQALMECLDRNGVDAAIVQPFPGAPDAARVHDRIAALAARHPKRIFGLASVNPHQAPDTYEREVRRCVEELGFVGVKLHTLGHAVSPLAADAQKVFEAARALHIPVMIHTGIGVPFAAPALAILRAREYAEVPVVLAHAGYAIYTLDAYVAARECPNIFLEPSWSNARQIRFCLDKLGPDRVMFGSDLPVNTLVEVAKIRAMELDKAQEEGFTAGTALTVFGLAKRLG
ncbi:MAG: amidohydrolase family protein [Deltaproteobacteria bacterium]|nr:amidohydrolase family protein [Deltaproteobacteria bacterium]